MKVENLLHLGNRSELRQWPLGWTLTAISHHPTTFLFVVVLFEPAIPYIEVVEEALCFGWIDSTLKRLPDGRLAQRLSPRRPKSHWTQLNMDRCVDLEDRGLMTEAGRQAFEKAFDYDIIPSDSEINQRIKEEAKLRRPKMYEQDSAIRNS